MSNFLVVTYVADIICSLPKYDKDQISLNYSNQLR